METKVDKNIPIPVNNKHAYPWGKLEVGDSFLLKHGTINYHQTVGSASARHRKKFIARKVDEGVRVWRVE